MTISKQRNVKHNRFPLWLTVASALIEFAGCSHKQVRLPTPTAVAPSDTSSYMDLEAGWKLKILVPLAKSPKAHRPRATASSDKGTGVSECPGRGPLCASSSESNSAIEVRSEGER